MPFVEDANSVILDSHLEENERQYESQWAGIRSVADKIGCSAETLRNWVRQAERDAGHRPGLWQPSRMRYVLTVRKFGDP